jgi:hypothetical protein
MNISNKRDVRPQDCQLATLCRKGQGHTHSCPVPSCVVAPLFERKVPNKSDNAACLIQRRRLDIVRIKSELLSDGLPWLVYIRFLPLFQKNALTSPA